MPACPVARIDELFGLGGGGAGMAGGGASGGIGVRRRDWGRCGRSWRR